MSTLPSAPTSVYQYYDKDGELLYVGITARGFSRGKEHERTKAWWPLVVSSSVEHYPDRHEAEVREAYLISYWRPPHNTIGRPTGPPRHRRESGTDWDSQPYWREVRSLLGRLGRCNTLNDLDLSKVPESLLERIEMWRRRDASVVAVRADLKEIIRSTSFSDRRDADLRTKP